MKDAFVGDYRPTKRIGIEELDGCINLFCKMLDDLDQQCDKRADMYAGALMALECIRYGRFEYPHELMEVFANKVQEYTE